MKKNIAMRVAAFLFILTMISTCAFATTFAKYTTHGEADDSARVAKWGVTVTGKSAAKNTLFEKSYSNDQAEVIVSATESVLAPGTNGNLSEFEIEGNPEVATRVSFSVVVGDMQHWVDAEGNFYCPLVIKINDTEIKDCTSAADLKQKIEKAIANVKFEYKPGDDISVKNLSIEWSWAFSTSKENDVKDTFLGNLINDDLPGNDPKISLSITCLIEQINDLAQ